MALVLAGAALGAEIRASLAPGAYARDVDAYFSCDAPGTALFYRFEGGRSAHPLEGLLRLSALSGEERAYLIHLEARGPLGVVESASFSYLIDRRPPGTIKADPASGIVTPGTQVSLTAPEAQRLSWALAPLSSKAQDYVGPIQIPGDAKGVYRYTLSVVAYDALGNAGHPQAFDYLCVPSGLRPASDALPSARPKDAPSLGNLAKGKTPAILYSQAGARISFDMAGAAAIQWRLAGAGDEWNAAIRTQEGKAVLDVPAPPHWLGELSIEWRGLDAKGACLIEGEPLGLSFGETPAAQGSESASGRLIPASDSRGAWFIADAAAGLLRFQANTGAWEDYLGPTYLAAPEGKDRLSVVYFLIRPDGSRSQEAEVSLAMPVDPGKPVLLGLPDGGISGAAVGVSPGQGAAVLRYEVSRGAEDPKPVGLASPILEPGTTFDVGPGQTMAFCLRARAYSSASADARAGDEAIARFVIDRTPPEPPVIRELPGPQALADKRFGFDPGEDSIYVQVFREGVAEGGYTLYQGPLTLKADPEGAVSYSLSAYAVDRAGNRSKDTKRASIIIDATSVYVSERGSDANDGSPTTPVASLKAALRIASVTARGRVRVYGAVSAREVLSVEGDLTLEGGFDADWRADPQAASTLTVAGLALKRGALRLERLTLQSLADGEAPLIQAEGASVYLVGSKLSGRGRAYQGLRLSGGALLDVKDSEIRLSSKGALIGLQAEGSRVSLESSVLDLEGAVIGTGVSLLGGSFTARNSTIRCSALQSSAALAMTEATFFLDHSLVEAVAEKGYASCFMQRQSSGSLDTCLLRSLRSAETVLFDCEGGYLKLSHVTAMAGDKPRAAYGFRLKNLALTALNTVLAAPSAPAQGALFDGNPDPKGIQAMASAGFKALERSGPRAALEAKILQVDPATVFEIDAKGMPRLTKASPLIDLGLAAVDGTGTDWYGRPRPSAYGKGLPDIGAFEYQ
jgi:hypothetical protein